MHAVGKDERNHDGRCVVGHLAQPHRQEDRGAGASEDHQRQRDRQRPLRVMTVELRDDLPAFAGDSCCGSGCERGDAHHRHSLDGQHHPGGDLVGAGGANVDEHTENDLVGVVVDHCCDPYDLGLERKAQDLLDERA